MDDRNFDDLTRGLAAGASRRRVLRSLAGAVAGGIGALAVRATGSAQPTCRGAERRCSQNANCCSGICDTTNPDPHKRYLCACPPGTEACRGECLVNPDDYLDDPANCGGCGIQCVSPVINAAPICCAGVCDYECVGGFQQCGVNCFSISTFPITLTPPATVQWTSTGLSLGVGDSVFISASGAVDINGGVGPNGPNGTTAFSNFCGPGVHGGAAIFRIGGSQVGLVGTGNVATATVAGVLEVGYCDCAGVCFTDNTGSFTFTVNCNVTPACPGPIS